MASLIRRVLDNGVTILYRQRFDSKTFGCIISSRVGSRHENPSQDGITHLSEHIIFQGNDNFPAGKSIKREIQILGDKTNAHTDGEHVANHGRFSADDTVRAFDLLSKVFFQPTFPHDAVEQERGIVLNEIKQYEDDHFHACWGKLQSRLWNGGLRSNTLGPKEIVSTLTKEEIYNWWHGKVLSGSNIIVSAYGPMDFISFQALVMGATKHLSKGEEVSSEADTINLGIRNFTERETDLNYTLIAYPGVSVSDPDRFKIGVLSKLVGGSMNSILFREVREKLQAAYQVGSSNCMFTNEGTFIAYAMHDPLKPAEDTIIQTLKNLRQFVTQDDFDSTIKSIIASTAINEEAFLNQLWSDEGNERFHREHLSLEDRLNIYKNITLDEVLAEADRIFSAEPSIEVIGSKDKAN